MSIVDTKRIEKIGSVWGGGLLYFRILALFSNISTQKLKLKILSVCLVKKLISLKSVNTYIPIKYWTDNLLRRLF